MLYIIDNIVCPTTGIPLIAYYVEKGGNISFHIHVDYQSDYDTLVWCVNHRREGYTQSEAELYVQSVVGVYKLK